MGGGQSRPSTADEAVTDDEDSREEEVQRVLSLHQKGKDHAVQQAFLKHSMSKSRLQVRLQKRQQTQAFQRQALASAQEARDAELEEEKSTSITMFHVTEKKQKKSKKDKKDKKSKKDKKDKKNKKDKKDKKDKRTKREKAVWPKDIPRNGVTIRFLQQILGRVKPEMNSSDVCRDLVKLDTLATKVPYTQMLETEKRSDYHGNSFVGPSTHYVAYCQDEPFDQLVSALDVFVNLSGSNPGQVFFWIDIFSLNQHTCFATITQKWLQKSLPAAIG